MFCEQLSDMSIVSIVRHLVGQWSSDMHSYWLKTSHATNNNKICLVCRTHQDKYWLLTNWHYHLTTCLIKVEKKSRFKIVATTYFMINHNLQLNQYSILSRLFLKIIFHQKDCQQF